MVAYISTMLFFYRVTSTCHYSFHHQIHISFTFKSSKPEQIKIMKELFTSIPKLSINYLKKMAR